MLERVDLGLPLLPMRGQHCMVIGAGGGLRIGVHKRRGQPRNGVQQIVLGVDSHLVRLDGACRGIDNHLALSAKLMADPSQPYLADVQDSARSPERLLGLVDKLGVHSVHQATVDLPCSLPQHSEDGHVMSSPTAGSAQSHPAATPATPRRTASDVNPSVRACSPSATSAAEPILRPTRMRYLGDGLVACEADDRRNAHRDEVRHRPRMREPGWPPHRQPAPRTPR